MNAARPSVRQSKLRGANPITSQPVPPVADVAPAPAQQVAAPTAQPAAEAAEPATYAGKRKKVSFDQHPADSARMRGAIVHTMLTEGNRNITEFINNTLMREVERLEAKYNGGKPFPPIGPGDPTLQGRPMGE